MSSSFVSFEFQSSVTYCWSLTSSLTSAMTSSWNDNCPSTPLFTTTLKRNMNMTCTDCVLPWKGVMLYSSTIYAATYTCVPVEKTLGSLTWQCQSDVSWSKVMLFELLWVWFLPNALSPLFFLFLYSLYSCFSPSWSTPFIETSTARAKANGLYPNVTTGGKVTEYSTYLY